MIATTKIKDYEIGDLLMLTIDTPVEHPAQLIVFKSIKTESYTVPATEETEAQELSINTLTYYPLTELGLEVAKSDNGNSPSTFHRETKFTVSNVHQRNLLEMNISFLRGYSKTLYEDILNEL